MFTHDQTSTTHSQPPDPEVLWTVTPRDAAFKELLGLIFDPVVAPVHQDAHS